MPRFLDSLPKRARRLIDFMSTHDAEWDESKHKRDEDGKFSSTGGGGSSGEIARLTEELKKTSRFGSGAQKRKELQSRIEALSGGKKEEPEKKPESRPSVPKPRKPDPPAGYPVTEQKKAQFAIIQATNPMSDDYHTGIRDPSDIMSPQEAFREHADEGFSYPDFTREDGEKALKTGMITVYSSKPIRNGGFVSPSKMMAGDYSGGGKVYAQTVPVDAVAWINGNEGQLADTRKRA